MLGTETNNTCNNYAYLVIRKKMQINVTRFVVFLDLDDFFLDVMRMTNWDIPAHPDFHA